MKNITYSDYVKMSPVKRQEYYKSLLDSNDVLGREIKKMKSFEYDIHIQESIFYDVKVKREHILLLKLAKFKYYPSSGDTVIWGVEGKRPFGNSSFPSKDEFKEIGWLPEDEDCLLDGTDSDGYTEKQYSKFWELVKECPIVVNKIIKSFDYDEQILSIS